MAKSKKVVYNADTARKERMESEITIGGEMFRPKPRTTRVIQEWLSLMPDSDIEEAVTEAGAAADEEFGTDLASKRPDEVRGESEDGVEQPAGDPPVKENPPEPSFTRAQMLKNVELLNEQLEVLLWHDVKGDGSQLERPDIDFLHDELDQEDAKAIMTIIAPDDEEIADAEKNSGRGGSGKS